MQENQPNSGGAGPEEGAERSRRTAAEIVADLERERDAEILKIRTKYDMKIARARKNATPIGERRRAALVLLDRMRDAYRTAHGDILLDEAVVDGEIASIFVAALQTNTTIAAPALEAALRVLDGKADDDGGAGGEGEAAAAGHAPGADASAPGGSTPQPDASGSAAAAPQAAADAGVAPADDAVASEVAPGAQTAAAASAGTPAAKVVAPESSGAGAATKPADAANDASGDALREALGF